MTNPTPLKTMSTIVLLNGTKIHTTAEPETEADDMDSKKDLGYTTFRVGRVRVPGVSYEAEPAFIAIAAVAYIEPYQGA